MSVNKIEKNNRKKLKANPSEQSRTTSTTKQHFNLNCVFSVFALLSTLCFPKLQSTCHYIANYYLKKMHARTPTCSYPSTKDHDLPNIVNQ